MKPEFLKELEKLLGPVAAHEFYGRFFVRLAGSRSVHTSDLATEQRRRAIRHARADFLEQISGMINPSEEVKSDRVETFRWELVIPKEFAKNG